MAAIKESVNLFALLDGDDPGDLRLVDFDSQLKDQPKKKLASPGYKPKKKEQASAPAKKKPAPAAASTKKKPASAAASGFKSEKNRTPAVATKAPSTSTATTPAPPAPSTDLTGVLFAYPSARERIFKQRQEEFERRQAKVRQLEEYERQQAKVNGGSVVSGDDDGKSAAAGAPSADKWKGKTHGVRVQQQGGAGNQYVDGAKKQLHTGNVKEAPTPPPSEKPAAAHIAVVQTPPPSIDDICQFPSLK